MQGNRANASFFYLFQLVVLLAWIVAFCFLLQPTGGDPLLGKFLRPDYWWLAKGGIIGLISFVLSLVYCNPHNRGRRGLGLFLQMGIMVLPLIYLPTALTSQLSPEAMKKRSFHVAQPVAVKKDASSTASENHDFPKDLSLLSLVTEPELYEGKGVSTVGMVHRDDNRSDIFLCYQLLMFCCAADARPIGILVEYDKSESLTEGSWVTVEGIVGSWALEDKRLTKITAEKVTPTQPPKFPYLVP